MFLCQNKIPTARTKHKPDSVDIFVPVIESPLYRLMTDFMFVTKQRSFALNYFKSPFLIVCSLARCDIHRAGGVSY